MNKNQKTIRITTTTSPSRLSVSNTHTHKFQFEWQQDEEGEESVSSMFHKSLKQSSLSTDYCSSDRSSKREEEEEEEEEDFSNDEWQDDNRSNATEEDEEEVASSDDDEEQEEEGKGGILDTTRMQIPTCNTEAKTLFSDVLVSESKYLFSSSSSLSIHFPYPAYFNAKRKGEDGAVKWTGSNHHKRRLNGSSSSSSSSARASGSKSVVRYAIQGCWEYNAVENALRRSGFKRTSNVMYANVFWGRPLAHPLYAKLVPGQKVNHFPGSGGIGHKGLLAKNIGNLKRKCKAKLKQHIMNNNNNNHHSPSFLSPDEEFAFCPTSFVLPGDRLLLEMFVEKHPGVLLIVKPPNSSCGRGIRVIAGDQTSKIKRKHRYVVQEYISNPFLIRQTKFDLRVYVLVTSFNPLKVYLFQDGLVRFAVNKYSLNRKSLKNTNVHLTNYSLNKKSENYQKSTANDGDFDSSKWSHQSLRKWFRENGIDDDMVWSRIEAVVLKTLLSIESKVNFNLARLRAPKGACFEVYGFDVMLDSDLQAHIIEVNVAPSLSSSSPLDKRIKNQLMADAFHVMRVPPVDVKEVLKFGHPDGTSSISSSTLLSSASRPSTARSRISSNISHDRTLTGISEEDRVVLVEFKEESNRAEASWFKCIFPTQDTYQRYKPFFDVERPYNILLAKFLMLTPEQQTRALVGRAVVATPPRVRPATTTAVRARQRRETAKQQQLAAAATTNTPSRVYSGSSTRQTNPTPAQVAQRMARLLRSSRPVSAAPTSSSSSSHTSQRINNSNNNIMQQALAEQKAKRIESQRKAYAARTSARSTRATTTTTTTSTTTTRGKESSTTGNTESTATVSAAVTSSSREVVSARSRRASAESITERLYHAPMRRRRAKQKLFEQSVFVVDHSPSLPQHGLSGHGYGLHSPVRPMTQRMEIQTGNDNSYLIRMRPQTAPMNHALGNILAASFSKKPIVARSAWN